MEAWAVIVTEEGVDRVDGIIRTLDAQARAERRAQAMRDEGILARAEKYEGPLRKPLV